MIELFAASPPFVISLDTVTLCKLVSIAFGPPVVEAINTSLRNSDTVPLPSDSIRMSSALLLYCNVAPVLICVSDVPLCAKSQIALPPRISNPIPLRLKAPTPSPVPLPMQNLYTPFADDANI